MFAILRQPFPRETTFRKSVFNALTSAVIVVVFLRIFQPFGFGEAPVKSLTIFALGYGVVTASIAILFALFEKTFRSLFVEERWTVGKNILVYVVIIFFIGSANLFYTSAFAGIRISVHSFLSFQFFTLAVTLVIVSTVTMIKYFRAMNFYKEGAGTMDKEVHEMESSSPNEIVVLKSENEKENLQLLIDDLFYIESADNYSKVFFRSNGKIKSTLIRTSLKRLEDQFTQPELFRCHRTYIVQLRNVKRVSGNSQGYRLHFDEWPESVPVSRRSAQEIKSRLDLLVKNKKDIPVLN